MAMSQNCLIMITLSVAKKDVDLSPIRMHQNYTRVNILCCANFTRGKQMAHVNANTHRGIFTYG